MQGKIFTGIVLLGTVLRLISLNQSLWLDEATSVLVARNFTIREILTKFSPGDFHPPLYYLLLKFWVSIFGASEVGARSLSVAAGVISIIFIYLIGKKLFSSKVGLISALLLSSAPLHIYYSQEARMYVLAGLFTLVLIWFFLKILEGAKSVFPWVGFLLSGILLIYTDYPTGLIFLFTIFYLLFFERDQFVKYKLRWLGVYGALAVSFLVWVPTLYEQLLTGIAVKTNLPGWWVVLGGVNLKQFALIPVKFMIGRISLYDKSLYALLIILVSSIFIFAFKNAILNLKKSKFLVGWFLIPIIFSALVGLKLSVFSYFRFLFILPAFYLLAAYGISEVKSKHLRNIGILALFLVNIFSSAIYLSNPRFQREDWKSAVSWIEKNSTGQSATIFVANSIKDPYLYYSTSVPAYGPQELSVKFDRIWLARYSQPIFDPKDSLRQQVENMGYSKISEKDFNGVIFWEYVKNIFAQI